MKKSLLMLTCCVALSGCAPAVFVAGAAAGGVVTGDNRTIGTKWNDQVLANNLREHLHSNEDIHYDANVSVATFNHSVLLTGTVPDQALHDKVLEITRGEPGVKRVHDQLRIARHITVSQATSDTWITTKIKTLMVAEKNLNSTHIKVVTDNGTVFLFGLVDRRQADLATNVTRHVPGVKKVVKLFEYM
ncbi:MAG: BON domain-containing protein [Pseudomonadota bacterium]|nr:BON domain-containing protein [Pseudomonadota bacterium]